MVMKIKLNFKKLIINSLTALFVLSTNCNVFAQESPSDDLKPFKVVIEKTENGIKMQSVEGSTWTDLSFGINQDRPQAINEYGMTELNKVSSQKDSDLAHFLFTITKTESGIVLKGMEGTTWTDLSFSLLDNQKQAIDQFGLTKIH